MKKQTNSHSFYDMTVPIKVPTQTFQQYLSSSSSSYPSFTHPFPSLLAFGRVKGGWGGVIQHQNTISYSHTNVSTSSSSPPLLPSAHPLPPFPSLTPEINSQNLVVVSRVVEVEWFSARSFRYSCLVRVAIAANFSERRAAISPLIAARREWQ